MPKNFFCAFQSLLAIVALLIVSFDKSKCYPPSFEDIGQIEQQYVKLLFDEALSDDERRTLAINLGDVHLNNASATKLEAMERKVPKFAEQLRHNLIKMRGEYALLTAKIFAKRGKIGMEALCKIWEMEKYVDAMVEISESEQSIAVASSSLPNQCEHFEQIDWTDRMHWPPGLEMDLSAKHLQFLAKLFAVPPNGRFALKEWFSEEKIAGESALAHRMRTAKVGGGLEQLRTAKRRMVQHLLVLDDLDMLEQKHPLIMSSDVISDERLAMLFERLFYSPPNSMEFNTNSYRLKVSFSIGKIYAYFSGRENGSNSEEEKLEKLWNLFEWLLSDLIWNDRKRDEKQTKGVEALDNLLEYLKKEFGPMGEHSQNYVANLTVTSFNRFLAFFLRKQNNAEKVREAAQNRHIVKQIFHYAEEGIEREDKRIAGEIWQWLETAGEGRRVAKSEEEEEEEGEERHDEGNAKNVPQGLLKTAAEVRGAKVKKHYDECPRVEMDFEELIRADNRQIIKDMGAFILALEYIEVLKIFGRHGQNKAMMRETELKAAIWYFKESIREMIGFADSLEGKSAKFEKRLKALKQSAKRVLEKEMKNLQEEKEKEEKEEEEGEEEEEKEEEEGEEEEDDDEKEEEELLCEVYQLAEQMSKAEELREESEAWRNRILEMTKRDQIDELFREHLIILPDSVDEIGTNWDKIDCTNGQKVATLRQRLTHGWHIKRIHFFCLDKLIKRFKRMQSLFCHGIGHVVPILVKDSLRLMASERVLDALEAKHPEILRFDKINVGLFVATFFAQMQCKSGTIEAQKYEARIYLPFVVGRLKTLEKALDNDFKLAPLWRNALREKIVGAKNDFYALLAKGSVEHLRQSHCELSKLVDFVEKGIERSGGEAATIAKWAPTECQAEEVIRETLSEQRRRKKLTMFKSLKQSLTVEWNRAKCRFPGFYTRLGRFLEDEAMLKQLAEQGHMLDPKVFESGQMLRLHYLDAMLLHTTGRALNVDGWMKADATLFIRWMNDKEFAKGCANQMVARRIGRVWDRTVYWTFAKSYDRMFDMELPEIGEEPREQIESFRRNYAAVKQYVESAVQGKKLKTDKAIQSEMAALLGKSVEGWMVTELTKIIRTAAAENDGNGTERGEKGKDGGQMGDQEKKKKHFDEWMQNRHFEALKQLIGAEDGQFRAKLREVLLETQEAISNLVNFLNDTENSESILRLVGIQTRYSTPTKCGATVIDSPNGPMSSRRSGVSPSCEGSISSMGSSSVTDFDSPTAERTTMGEKKRGKRKKGKGNGKKRGKALTREEEDKEEVHGRDKMEEEDQRIAEEEEGKKEGKEEGKAEEEKNDEEPKEGKEETEMEEKETKEEEEKNRKEEREDKKEQKKEKNEKGIEKQHENENREEKYGQDKGEDEKEKEEEKSYKEGIEKEEKKENKEKKDEEERHKENLEREKKKEEKKENKEKKDEEERHKENLEREKKKEKEEKGEENFVGAAEEHFGRTTHEEEEKQSMSIDRTTHEEEEKQSMSIDRTTHEEEEKQSMSRVFNFYLIQNDGTKIGDLAGQDVLLTNYADLFWHLMEKCGRSKRKFEFPQLENKEGISNEWSQTVNGIVQLLDLGIYANEIWQRTKAIHQIRDIWHEIGIERAEVAKIERKWAQLKGETAEKGAAVELEQSMDELVKQLLRIMDKKPILDNGSGEKMGEQMKGEMHRRKLALLMANGTFASFSETMRKSREDPRIAQLVNLNSIECPSNAFVHLVQKANLQRKIDAKLYKQYRNNSIFSKFVSPKMHANFVPAQLDHLSELWQPFDFGEERLKPMDTYNLMGELMKASKYLIFDVRQKQKVENLMAQMEQIVQNWSAGVIFQFSADYLLRPNDEQSPLLSACLMASEFDVFGSFLGADFYCDLTKREKCHGKSLYCELCKNSDVSSLVKANKDKQFDSVPQLHFSFKTVQMTVLAIVVPGMGPFRPKETPFDGHQIDTISKHFDDEIEKLIRADHFFDEGQFRSSQSINSQTMELLANALILTDSKKEMEKIMGQKAMFSRFDEMLTENRQMALHQRELVKDLVVTLKTFANFVSNFKILEMISDKSDTKRAPNGKEANENSEELRMSKFSLTLAYMEIWAKSNHISEAHIGYLDVHLLTIMVAKIFLLYPNASIPTLIEKFFVTYSTWKWPLPIQLVGTDFNRRGEFLSWTPGREWITKRQFSPKTMLKLIRPVLSMAVITPTFPEQNLAKNANLSSLKCLRNHMIKALAKIRKNSGQNAFLGPLESTTFSAMYDHFIAVKCAASQYQIENFSNFVGQRIGHELTEMVEEPLERWIKFCHVFPDRISLGQCNGTPKSPTKNCKKIWLIGIEMNEPLEEMGELKAKMEEKLRKEFDEKIRNDFGSHFVGLRSEFVDERERLAELLRDSKPQVI